MLVSSIRVRLTLWYAVWLSLILACLSAGVYLLVRSRLESALDTQLQRQLASIVALVKASPPASAATTYVPSDVLFLVTDGRQAVYQSEGWCRAGLLKALTAKCPCASGVWRSESGKRYSLRSARLEAGGRKLEAVVAESTGFFDDILNRLSWVFLLYVPCAAALCTGGGYWLARRALSPIGRMASKARQITAESLSERLPAGNPRDELGSMAAVFNETLGRLEDSFERLRAFAANVSHELRTPLTAIRSVSEAALERPRNEACCRDALGSVLEEVDRMTRLVDCLLSMARAENGQARLPREPVDLAALAETALDLVRVLAEEKQQSIDLLAPAPCLAQADSATVSQALIDLLDNAIRYTPAGGRIRVAVDRGPDGAPAVVVEDNGPGIRAEDRERIFHRFTRADTSMSETTAGSGLGLAIARSAVEANGGRLEYEEASGGGSRFRISFAAPKTGKD